MEYPTWQPLLDACEDYARLSGWRFSRAEFMNLERQPSGALHAARVKAMPVALDYGERVAKVAAQHAAPEASALLGEFCQCQRLVANEALHKTMLSTCCALGLDAESLGIKDEDEGGSCAYQDLSQPFEEIARRLHRHERATAAVRPAREARALSASFVVEFGLEHGLPELADPTSEAQLHEFLERVEEWREKRGEGSGASRDELRELVLSSLHGRTIAPLRRAAMDWASEHRGAALVGGALLGGAIGLVVAGAAIAIAGRGRAPSRR